MISESRLMERKVWVVRECGVGYEAVAMRSVINDRVVFRE